MPITLPISYRTYAAQLKSGTLSLAGITCSSPRGCASDPDPPLLVLSETTVYRELALVEPDEFGVCTILHLVAVIALSYCPTCGSRLRLLPIEVLPQKVYSLPVITRLAEQYAPGQRSLRDVADKQHGNRTPAHSTLHSWTEGLGAFVEGDPAGELPGSTPHSRLQAETVVRYPETAAILPGNFEVDERRYRSEERQGRLAEIGALLSTSRVVAELKAPCALTEWRRLGVLWMATSPLVFRTGISYTASERVASTGRASSGLPPKETQKSWPTATRSPPGDSS